MSEATVGCTDLCVSCSSAVRTFANLQVVGDEKHLVPTWMPPGGCTCSSMQIDPNCPRCFPPQLLCQPCGESHFRGAEVDGYRDLTESDVAIIKHGVTGGAVSVESPFRGGGESNG